MRAAWGVRDEPPLLDPEQSEAAGRDPRTGALLQGPPSRPPRRAIALALFLLGAGFALFVAGLALRAQHNDAGFPLLILGVLMLVPGAYHSNIVYRAWRGTPGYSFAQLPEL